MTAKVRIGFETEGTDKSAKDINKIDDAMGKFAGGIGNVVKELTGFSLADFTAAGAVAILAKGIGSMMQAAGEAEKIQRQLNQTINSTGGLAGLTADDINEMSTEFSRLMGVEDDEISKAGALMLTFTNISKETFPDAVEASLNLSAALGQDLQSSVIQVGKALNDPDGMSAMKRIGVSFSDAQIAMGKQLFETGKKVEYQQLVLAELNKEFGGQAAQNMLTYSGTMDKVKNSVGNLAEAIGEKGLPVMKVLNLGFANSIDMLTDWIILQGKARDALSVGGDTQGFYNRSLDETNRQIQEENDNWVLQVKKVLDAQREAERMTGINQSLAGSTDQVRQQFAQYGMDLDKITQSTQDLIVAGADLETHQATEKTLFDQLAAANTDLANSQQSYIENQANDFASALERSGAGAEKVAAGLKIIDDVQGTNLARTAEYKTKTDELFKLFANGKIDEGQLKTGLENLKSSFSDLQDGVIKARDEVAKLQADIDALHGKDITINIIPQGGGQGDFTHSTIVPPSPRGGQGAGGGKADQQYAGGTNDAPGGLAVVGEQGPEVAYFPPHTQIIPNDQLGGVTINMQPGAVTINAPQNTSPQQLAKMVSNELSKMTRSAVKSGKGYSGSR
jgi:hypothetical protein